MKRVKNKQKVSEDSNSAENDQNDSKHKKGALHMRLDSNFQSTLTNESDHVIPILYGSLPPLVRGQCAVCIGQKDSLPLLVSNSSNVPSTPLQPGTKTFRESSNKKQKQSNSKSKSSAQDDEEHNTSPIILCDGQYCSREFHISCLDPPLSQIPPGDWYCNDCNALGSSRHLETYFGNCQTKRTMFDCSRAYVESLLMNAENVASKSTSVLLTQDVLERERNGEDKKAIRDKMNHNTEPTTPFERKRKSRGGTPLKAHSSKRKKARGKFPEQTFIQDSSKRKKKHEETFLNNKIPKSELGKLCKLHRLALTGVPKPPFLKKTGKIVDHSNLSNGIMITKERNMNLSHPSFLIGKHVRLYCPVDNCYHIGRILDWRRADDLTPPKQQQRHFDPTITKKFQLQPRFFGTGEIGRSEFFVCFPEGMNGRKKRIYQWIILEEHSLAVSVSIIWGLFNKNRGLNGWRPAQTLARTSLELLPFRDYLVEEDDDEDENFMKDIGSRNDTDNNGFIDVENAKENRTNKMSTRKGTKKKSPSNTEILVLFFGEESFATLKLYDEMMDFFSPAFQPIRKSHFRSGYNPNASSFFSISHVVGNGYSASNDDENISHLSLKNKTSLSLAVALATVEHDEQKRLKHWHEMPLKNPAHFRALTIADEVALETLEVCDDAKKSSNMIGSSSKNFPSNPILTKNSKLLFSDQSFLAKVAGPTHNTTLIVPKLCPSIERGLDRSWLTSFIEFDSMEKSLDTMSSISVKPVECMPSAIAELMSKEDSNVTA